MTPSTYSKCKHSRAESLKGIFSPEQPTASEDLIESVTSTHWNQALVSDWHKTATNKQPHHTQQEEEGRAVLKGKAKGNQSLVRVIVQRRAFILQTHHCESASHWSPGLKPHPFGIYGKKPLFLLFLHKNVLFCSFWSPKTFSITTLMPVMSLHTVTI